MSMSTSRATRAGFVLVNLLLIVALGFGAYVLVDGVSGALRDGDRLFGGPSLNVHVQLPPERVGLPPGVEHASWLPVTVRVEDATAQEVVLSAALDLAQVLLFVGVLLPLRGLAGSVRRGDPFDPGNVQRLRTLGFVLALGGPGLELLSSALRTSLYNSLPPGEFGEIGTHGLSLPGNLLLSGLGAFILAEVFAHGLRLREDLEGTV